MLKEIAAFVLVLAIQLGTFAISAAFMVLVGVWVLRFIGVL